MYQTGRSGILRNMSFSKDADQLEQSARRAYDEGQRLFVAVLSTPSSFGGTEGTREVRDWSEAMQRVEQCGWQVDQFSSLPDGRNHPRLTVMFRRAHA